MTISTQKFLEINDIRQGALILKNNTIRAVLMISSLNFDLKSQEEKESIIFQFQSFLNSLDFSIQIISQTRKLNITSYLDKLKEIEKKQTNKLLKIQTSEYSRFINGLVSGGAIMSKFFYIVVPYSLVETKGIDLTKKIKTSSKELTEQEFKRMNNQLSQRLMFVASGIKRCGSNVIALNTTQLIDLFWTTHHPLQAEQGYYPKIPDDLIN